MSRFAILAFFVVVAACGGKSQPATSTVEHADTMEHKDHGGPPEVVAFHDRLAPLWHAEAGPARTTDTCNATGDFDVLIGNLEKAPAPPTVDSTAWGERVGALRTSASELGKDCADNGAAEFTARFETMHNSFHALIELLPHTETSEASSGK